MRAQWMRRFARSYASRMRTAAVRVASRAGATQRGDLARMRQGRVRIMDVSQSEHDFVRAQICLHTDTRMDEQERARASAEALVEEVRSKHHNCCALTRRIREAVGKESGAVLGAFDETLDTIFLQRREVLCERGLDACPVDTLDDDVQALLGVGD